MYKKIIRFILYANHHANQRKVRKTMPTNVPTTFNKWQNSAEKGQAHNLKVVGSNPTPATNLFNKINKLHNFKNFGYWVFLCFKPDNDYRVINKVINVRQVYFLFLLQLNRYFQEFVQN